MIKFLYYLSFLVFVGASCQQTEPRNIDNKDCKSDKVLKNSTWLKEKIRKLEAYSSKGSCSTNFSGCFYIARGQVHGEIIFEIGICCPGVDYAPAYYNCDGTLFCEFKNNNCPIQSDIDDREIIWSISSK